jgi:hypothetical protein
LAAAAPWCQGSGSGSLSLIRCNQYSIDESLKQQLVEQ